LFWQLNNSDGTLKINLDGYNKTKTNVFICSKSQRKKIIEKKEA